MKSLLFLFFLLLGSHNADGQIVRPEGVQIVTTTGTTNVSTGVGVVLLNPASLLLSATIILPSTPQDRDICMVLVGGNIIFGLGVVTALTIRDAGGTTLVSGLLVASGSSMIFVYMSSTGVWTRM